MVMKRNQNIDRFVAYIRKTYKNKLYALALLGFGLVCELISNDATALIFMATFAIPVFFAKESLVD